MNSENQVLVIDAGNTSIKCAQFANNKLQKMQRINFNKLEEIVGEHSTKNVIISSVLSEEETDKIISLFKTNRKAEKKKEIAIKE
jgi:pantothenate kinase type III